jgi:hypothetical protein
MIWNFWVGLQYHTSILSWLLAVAGCGVLKLFQVDLISSTWSLPCSFQVPCLLLLDACPAPPGCLACSSWSACPAPPVGSAPCAQLVLLFDHLDLVLISVVWEMDLVMFFDGLWWTVWVCVGRWHLLEQQAVARHCSYV